MGEGRLGQGDLCSHLGGLPGGASLPALGCSLPLGRGSPLFGGWWGLSGGGGYCVGGSPGGRMRGRRLGTRPCVMCMRSHASCVREADRCKDPPAPIEGPPRNRGQLRNLLARSALIPAPKAGVLQSLASFLGFCFPLQDQILFL